MTSGTPRHEAPERIDLAAVFKAAGGYQPIIGGLRHLTWLRGEPPPGTVVPLRDGDAYKVGSKPRSPHIYDCHACGETYVEEHAKPASKPPRPVPSPRRRRAYVDRHFRETP